MKRRKVVLSVDMMVMVCMGISLCVSGDPRPACILDFSKYPYLPAGECIGQNENISDWDSLPTTSCCRNGLNSLSESLAVHANVSDSLFLEKNLWDNCNNSFTPFQDSVTISSCGFDGLYSGSSTPCSNLSLSIFKKIFPEQYIYLSKNCSDFINPFFDSACNACTTAIKDVKDYVMKYINSEQNSSAKAMCGVAVVIATAAQHIGDNVWVGDFYRCLDSLDAPEPNYIKPKSSITKAMLAMFIATTAILVVVVIITTYVTKKKPPIPVEGKEVAAWSGDSGLYRFSKAEIENAMNFSNHKVSLGAGSAGRVYKGVLPSGQVIAIKHIYKSNMSDSFTREVEGLSRIRHPNLVCLFGCCVEGGEQYLVYEYCSNGNLAQHLLKRDSDLPWDRRVRILRDCALALRFLHGHPDGVTVHRDIKLTNILLTEKMEPKLSDFGLAKMLGMEESKVFTDVRGTIGYMDPEYMSNAKLTCASDVYSFGIVALQLLSGRKVIDLDLDARDQLTRKAKDVIMGKRPMTDFEDPRLNRELSVEDFESILHVAVLCVAKSSKGRPTIDVVFTELDRALKNCNAKKDMNETSYVSTPQSRSLDAFEV